MASWGWSKARIKVVSLAIEDREHSATQKISGLVTWHRMVINSTREGPVGSERRRAPRYPFGATAQVVDLRTQKSASLHVSELSLYGCFIDMADPFPVGTQILVKIFSQGQYFEGPGTVMHAQPNAGIGVSFHDVPRQYVPALKVWLIQAAQALYGSKV